MDILAILEVAIGIVTVYLVLSLVCTSLTETFIGKSIRREVLRQSITSLVGEDLTNAIYETPEVDALRGPADAKRKKGETNGDDGQASRADPSYIPTDVFARSLLDVATGGEWRRSGGLPSVLRDELVAFSNPPEKASKASKEQAKLGRKLVDLLDEAGGDIEVFKNKIELWFDRTGDRSKGWFKRRLNRKLLLLGFLIAASVNADTIMIFQRLTDDPTLREAAVEVAVEQLKTNGAPGEGEPPAATATSTDASAIESVREQVGTVAPFVGWSANDPFVETLAAVFLSSDENDAGADGENDEGSGFLANTGSVVFASAAKIAGLALTAFAISLGAPFWFDLLQRLVNIRGSVQASKPKEMPASEAGAAAATDDETETSAGGPVYTGAMAGFAPTAATLNLGNAYWLARSADLAYETDAKKVTDIVASWGMVAHIFEAKDKTLWKGHDVPTVDTQGFIAVDDNAVLVCFRGTEPTKPADIVTDLDFKPEAVGDYGSGEIHRGFKNAVDSVWPSVEKILATHATKRQAVWFTGHSLGGALAVLAASRYDKAVKGGNEAAKQTIAEAEKRLENESDAAKIAELTTRREAAMKQLRGRVAGVYTIGQPRVGDVDFADELDNRLGKRHVRIINNRDVVPRVPVRAMGFKHSGTVLYFDEFGRLHRDPGLWYRLLDTVVITREEVGKAKEGVKDHSSKAYVDLLDKARSSTSALTRLAVA